MRKVPLRFQEFNKENPRIAEAYENLAAACRKSGPLSEREQSLAKLGIAIGSGMEGRNPACLSACADGDRIPAHDGCAGMGGGYP